MPLLDKLLRETLSKPNYYLNAGAVLQEDNSGGIGTVLPSGVCPSASYWT